MGGCEIPHSTNATDHILIIPTLFRRLITMISLLVLPGHHHAIDRRRIPEKRRRTREIRRQTARISSIGGAVEHIALDVLIPGRKLERVLFPPAAIDRV